MATDPLAGRRDADAVEYVLGTLSAAERQGFERDMAADPALARAVRDWEARLAPLDLPTPAIAPSAATWEAIAGRLAAPEAPEAVAPSAAVIDLAALRRSRNLWRGVSVAATALAASLALTLGLGRLVPPPEQRFVAVVNRSGEMPALIVSVDGKAGIVRVRALSAETPADHSLELWSIVAGGAPRTLGLVSPEPRLHAIPPQDRIHLHGATLAVSVEPRGGSPTGAPTGPVVYQGKLVPDP